MTEKELITRAKKGNQEAFGQLVLAHQNKVYTLCVHLLGSREEAEDLAQEAFLKAWRNLDGFLGESSFATWMHRLTTNLCLDHLRKQTRRQNVSVAVSLDDEEATVPEPVDHSGDPHEELERAERQRALTKGLQELPEHYRRPLVMREVSGMSYQEIADALNLDLGTVKSRIDLAREALRKILLRDGNFFSPDASNHTKNKNRR
ncbi:MAG: sigma-70 family RNA polymerase sigma factor [Clostridium sp.]|nr:sigma-70 family RNA polymerase sigma factor [Clostridium sp.]